MSADCRSVAAATPGGSWAGQAVFNALLTHGPLTRAAMAHLTGLSRVTASGVVDQLIGRGLVEQSGLANTGGPGARSYAVVPDCAFAAGIAIDRRRMAVLLTDVTGRVVSRFDRPIDDDETVAATVQQAVTAALEGLRTTPLATAAARIRRIVIGASGVIDPDAREVSYAVDQPVWKAALPALLRSTLQCPVVYENDVNLAALAEARYGAGKRLANRDDPDLVLIWLDDGIAAGVILQGRIYRGAAGWAGEIAFLRAVIHGAGADEIADGFTVTTLQRAIGIRGAIALARQHDVDIEVALRAVPSSGDIADAVRDEIARRVALAAAGPAFVFDPDVVVLAGRVVRPGGAALLEAVRRELAVLGPAPAHVALSETGADAILLGAMLLALDETRDTLFADLSQS